MMFLWVILFLFFFENLTRFFFKYIPNKNLFIFLALTGLIYVIFIFNPPIPSGNSILFYSVITGLLVYFLIVNLKNRLKYITLQIPELFFLIFINFILISLIIFGFERQNNVLNFIITLTAFHYLVRFIKSLNNINVIN
jgi:hypothetical protein